jgi:creatinine amidohydrolase/Fe(II)-dependent formamide hydrolase-like protein
LLHISPEDVWLDERVAGNGAPLAELLPRMREGGIAAVSPVGVLGDPTTATAADGEALLGEMVGGAVTAISAWAPGRDGMLR